MAERPGNLPNGTAKTVFVVGGTFLLLLAVFLFRAVKSVESTGHGPQIGPRDPPVPSGPPLPQGPPRILARPQKAPHDLTVSDNWVFFCTQGADDERTGEIMKVAVRGGTPETLAERQKNPHQVTAGGGFVYWLSSEADGSVMRTPITGGTVTRVASTVLFGDGALAADSTHVYWLNKNRLMRAAHGTKATEKIAEAGEPNTVVRALAVHADLAYWFDGRTLWAASISKGSAAKMAEGSDAPWNIAADESGVFWTDRRSSEAAEGEVWKILFENGESQLVYRPIRLPWGVAVDRDFVYWASNTGKGYIGRASKSGGPAQVLASNQGYPVDVEVDENGVYWNNVDSKEIVMLSK